MTKLCMALVLVGVLALAGDAHANLFGKYLQACPRAVGPVQDDPILAPGGVADHMHTESGSLAFSATMTTASMYAADTTCFLHENHSAYWAPTFQKDGVDYTASFSSYYAAAGADPAAIAGGRVQPFPPGFRTIYGNSHSTVLQSTSIVRWRCGGQTATLSAPPTTCPASSTSFAMEIDANKFCWDGMELDTVAHPTSFVGGVAGGGCPAANPIRLPQLQAAFSYPIAALGGYLSSDHEVGPKGRSAHFDLWEAQDPDQQDQLTRCLNDPARNFATAPTCGTFTYDGGAPGINPWQKYLVPWSKVIGYVNSSGTATGNPPAGTP